MHTYIHTVSAWHLVWKECAEPVGNFRSLSEQVCPGMFGELIIRSLGAKALLQN